LPGVVQSFGPHDPTEGQPARADGGLDDGDGSPYWFLAVAFPGFGQFRYPSKLLTFTALAIAALAGLGWDRLTAGRTRRFIALGTLLLLLSLGALATTVAGADRIVAAFKAHPLAKSAGAFGPFHPRSALSSLQRSVAHGGIVYGLALGLALAASRRPRLAGAPAPPPPPAPPAAGPPAPDVARPPARPPRPP